MMNNKSFNRWLFGYFSVILIVMSVMLVGHIFVVNISSSEIEKGSANLVQQTKKLCDESLGEAEVLASQLLSAPAVTSISTYHSTMAKNIGEYVRNMNSDITTVLKISKVVTEAYVVFRDLDICVNHQTKFNLNNFYEIYFSNYFDSKEECEMELFSNGGGVYKTYKILSGKDGERKVAFIYNSVQPIHKNKVYDVYVLDFDQMLLDYAGENMGTMVFVDGENRPLTNAAKWTEPFDLPNEEGTEELNLAGNHYVVNYATSSYLQGKFVHLVDKSDYFKYTKVINTIIIVSYIVCLLIGLFIAWLNARRNYNFVTNLVDKMNLTERQMRKQRNRLKESLLENIVYGNVRHIREEAKGSNLFSGGEFMVMVVFDILDYGVNEKDDKDMTNFVISNVFSELVTERLGATMDYCDTKGYFVCILSFSNGAILSDDVRQQVDYTNEFLNKNLGVIFNSAVSTVFSDAEKIPEQYEKAQQALQRDAEETLQTQQSVRCQNIKQYIKDNYTNVDLSVQSIADHFGLSFGYISRYFKEKTGQGLAKYIIEVRIEKAKELLENTNETCAKIATEVGFLSDHVFIKNFSKIEGITPGAYRDAKSK